MSLNDEEKTELARKLAAELPWIDAGTARKAIGVLAEDGSLRVCGREVLPEEIPSGATARVEYDVLTKNHMTGEFVITRHMEITGRKVPDPRSVAVAHEKVANVRYFIVAEAPKTMREKLAEAFKSAPGSLTDRGLAEYLLARFDVAEKDAEKPKRTIRSHQRGSARELGESDKDYEKRTGPVYGPETWRGRSRD